VPTPPAAPRAENTGQIDSSNFAYFYRDALMARGLEKEEADSRTLHTYQASAHGPLRARGSCMCRRECDCCAARASAQGKSKSQVMYEAYDADGSRSISFDGARARVCAGAVW
jgi:hypothetical protein